MVKAAGDQHAVEVISERMTGRQIASAESRHRDEFQRGPVTYEQPDKPDDLPAYVRVEHDQSGEQVSQTDSSKHTRQTSIRPIEFQQAVVNHAKQHEDQPASDYMPIE